MERPTKYKPGGGTKASGSGQNKEFSDLLFIYESEGNILASSWAGRRRQHDRRKHDQISSIATGGGDETDEESLDTPSTRGSAIGKRRRKFSFNRNEYETPSSISGSMGAKRKYVRKEKQLYWSKILDPFNEAEEDSASSTSSTPHAAPVNNLSGDEDKKQQSYTQLPMLRDLSQRNKSTASENLSISNELLLPALLQSKKSRTGLYAGSGAGSRQPSARMRGGDMSIPGSVAINNTMDTSSSYLAPSTYTSSGYLAPSSYQRPLSIITPDTSPGMLKHPVQVMPPSPPQRQTSLQALEEVLREIDTHNKDPDIAGSTNFDDILLSPLRYTRDLSSTIAELTKYPNIISVPTTPNAPRSYNRRFSEDADDELTTTTTTGSSTGSTRNTGADDRSANDNATTIETPAYRRRRPSEPILSPSLSRSISDRLYGVQRQAARDEEDIHPENAVWDNIDLDNEGILANGNGGHNNNGHNGTRHAHVPSIFRTNNNSNHSNYMDTGMLPGSVSPRKANSEPHNRAGMGPQSLSNGPPNYYDPNFSSYQRGSSFSDSYPNSMLPAETNSFARDVAYDTYFRPFEETYESQPEGMYHNNSLQQQQQQSQEEEPALSPYALQKIKKQSASSNNLSPPHQGQQQPQRSPTLNHRSESFPGATPGLGSHNYPGNPPMQTQHGQGLQQAWMKGSNPPYNNNQTSGRQGGFNLFPDIMERVQSSYPPRSFPYPRPQQQSLTSHQGQQYPRSSGQYPESTGNRNTAGNNHNLSTRALQGDSNSNTSNVNFNSRATESDITGSRNIFDTFDDNNNSTGMDMNFDSSSNSSSGNNNDSSSRIYSNYASTSTNNIGLGDVLTRNLSSARLNVGDDKHIRNASDASNKSDMFTIQRSSSYTNNESS